MNLDKSKKRIAKRVNKGFQGYPMITLAYYGPDDTLATKVVVGFILEENAEVQVERFTSEDEIREDVTVQTTILKIIERADAKSVTLVDRIIGCPHEEGIDYAEGEECSTCTFWQGRDRFTGKKTS